MLNFRATKTETSCKKKSSPSKTFGFLYQEMNKHHKGRRRFAILGNIFDVMHSGMYMYAASTVKMGVCVLGGGGGGGGWRGVRRRAGCK